MSPKHYVTQPEIKGINRIEKKSDNSKWYALSETKKALIISAFLYFENILIEI